MLSADLERKTAALIAAAKKDRVNFDDLEDVQARTVRYLNACRDSGTFPSVNGLCCFGFGVDRNSFYYRLKTHPESPVSQYLETVRDLIADVLVNAALNRNADSIMSIFVFKNHHAFRDSVQVEPVTPVKSEDDYSAEDMRKRYMLDIEDTEIKEEFDV